MTIRWILATAALCAALASVPDARAADDPPPRFEALAARLAAQHPDYLAMQGEVDAARAAIDVAGAMPDPMLEVELMNLDSETPGLDRAAKYTWEQMFPLWGKRGLRREVAEQGRQGAEARRDLTLAGLHAELRSAFAELYAAHRATAINDEVAALLEDMAQGARTRYANGMAAQQDLIRVRAEQTVLDAETINLKGEIRRASVRINSLVGDPLDVELAAPAAMPDTAGFGKAWSELEQRLDATPALAAADAAVRGGRLERELAARERYPDVARSGCTPDPHRGGQRRDRHQHDEEPFHGMTPVMRSKLATARWRSTAAASACSRVSRSWRSASITVSKSTSPPW